MWSLNARAAVLLEAITRAIVEMSTISRCRNPRRPVTVKPAQARSTAAVLVIMMMPVSFPRIEWCCLLLMTMLSASNRPLKYTHALYFSDAAGALICNAADAGSGIRPKEHRCATRHRNDIENESGRADAIGGSRGRSRLPARSRR